MVAGIIASSLLAGFSYLAGKSGGGGAIEIGTSKKSNQTTNTVTNTYAPTITRTYDVQYNMASGGSTISTKKEQSVSQTPEISPQIAVIPQTAQGGGVGSSSSGGFDVLTIILIAGAGIGGYYLIKKI